MTGKQLRAFLAVAETLNFAVAAERVHLSQPALSLSIKGLEESLGGQLLTRTTRRVRLTPEGEVLVPRARLLLADWDDTTEMLRQQFTLQRGRITVAAMPSFACNVLPGLLAAYRERYSQIDIAVHDVVHEQVLEYVASGRVELGFGFEPDAADAFQFVPLFNDRFVAIVPPEFPFDGIAEIGWTELLEHPFITLQRPSTVRRLLEQSLDTSRIPLKVALECHQLATVGALVAMNLGVSAVPALCESQMVKLGARCVTLHSPVVGRAVGLVMRRNAELSTSARALQAIALGLKWPQ